ncbi:hypothetical protein AC1031_004452 [Aphanomyces cochlioides]|nr:hypothetical protein AC1031_004452 [Aphanomyces cochlioides]
MLALLLSLMLVATAALHIDMINGHTAPEPILSSIVSLSLNKGGIHTCTGVLITPQHILTAAHCIGYVEWAVFRSNGIHELLEIAGTRLHPNAKTRFPTSYDVGVLVLRKKSKQPPAKLHFDNLTLGTPVWVYGGGNTAFNLTTSSPNIKEMNANVTLQFECPIDDVNTTLVDSMVCINGGIMCKGDSGGPVTVVQDGQHYVVAVASWAHVQCDSPIGGYARVSAARDFLEPYLSPPRKTPERTPHHDDGPPHHPLFVDSHD